MDPGGIQSGFRISWDDTWFLNLRLTEGVRPSLRLTASPSSWMSVDLELAIYTDEGDPAILSGLRPLLSLPSNTRSCESYATARGWIQECLSEHPRAQESGRAEVRRPRTSQLEVKDRPRRLVHVQSRGSGLLLRLVDALSDTQAYATLSHCVRKSAILDQTKLINLL
jgi:hypothetical protein